MKTKARWLITCSVLALIIFVVSGLIFYIRINRVPYFLDEVETLNAVRAIRPEVELISIEYSDVHLDEGVTHSLQRGQVIGVNYVPDIQGRTAKVTVFIEPQYLDFAWSEDRAVLDSIFNKTLFAAIISRRESIQHGVESFCPTDSTCDPKKFSLIRKKGI